MKRKVLTLLLALFVLINCATLPFGAVYAETTTETNPFNYSNNFDALDNIAASTDPTAVANATGLTFTDTLAEGHSYSIENGVVKILANANTTGYRFLDVVYNFPLNQSVTTGEISASFSFLEMISFDVI